MPLMGSSKVLVNLKIQKLNKLEYKEKANEKGSKKGTYTFYSFFLNNEFVLCLC